MGVRGGLDQGAAIKAQHTHLQPVEQRRECGFLTRRRRLTQLAPDWKAPQREPPPGALPASGARCSGSAPPAAPSHYATSEAPSGLAMTVAASSGRVPAAGSTMARARASSSSALARRAMSAGSSAWTTVIGRRSGSNRGRLREGARLSARASPGTLAGAPSRRTTLTCAYPSPLRRVLGRLRPPGLCWGSCGMFSSFSNFGVSGKRPSSRTSSLSDSSFPVLSP